MMDHSFCMDKSSDAVDDDFRKFDRKKEKVNKGEG